MRRKGCAPITHALAIHHPKHTAPPWLQTEANRDNSGTIVRALRSLSPHLLLPIQDVVTSLRNLSPGSHYRVPLRVRSVCVPWPDRSREVFHGTGWPGVQSILESGFLPTFGAGRHSAYARFGVDFPVVYATPLLHTAATYPQLLHDDSGTPCGDLDPCGGGPKFYFAPPDDDDGDDL